MKFCVLHLTETTGARTSHARLQPDWMLSATAAHRPRRHLLHMRVASYYISWTPSDQLAQGQQAGLLDHCLNNSRIQQPLDVFVNCEPMSNYL